MAAFCSVTFKSGSSGRRDGELKTERLWAARHLGEKLVA
jgi:hypothetical protein